MKPVRVGLVGLGKQAIEDHLPGLKSCRGVQLVGLCDTNIERFALAGADETPCFIELTRLFREAKPDLLVVCTPHDTHQEICLQAAEARVSVFKEKPLATTYQKGVELLEAFTKADRYLVVNTQRRFHPIYRAVPQLLEQIGDLFLVDVRYTITLASPYDGWRGKKSTAGGGCLLDMGYHMVDLLIWYFGLPDNIQGHTSCYGRNSETSTDVEDTAIVNFGYRNGLNGVLVVSRCVAPKEEQLTVSGTLGSIRIERGAVTRFDVNGEIVESLTRSPAWPTASTAQFEYLVKILNGVERNTLGADYHLKHCAFIQAAYESAGKDMQVTDLRGSMNVSMRG